MTQHGNTEESREHLRDVIGSNNLLARLDQYHGSIAPTELLQSNNSHEPIKVSISDECFAPFTAPIRARLGFVSFRMTGRQLLRIVAEFYDLTVEDLRGPRRTKSITRARFAFYYLASKYVQLTNSAIARLTSRDTSTVHKTLSAFNRKQTRLTKEPRLADEIELIGLRLGEQFGVYGETAE